MKNNSLKFFTNNSLVDKQTASNNLFKRKYEVSNNIPIYKEIPLNDSLLRDTNSLYKNIIEGSNRIVTNLTSINSEMRIFANFDNYLQIKPKFKNKNVNQSTYYYDELNTNKLKNINEIERLKKEINIRGNKKDLETELENEEMYIFNKDINNLKKEYDSLESTLREEFIVFKKRKEFIQNKMIEIDEKKKEFDKLLELRNNLKKFSEEMATKYLNLDDNRKNEPDINQLAIIKEKMLSLETNYNDNIKIYDEVNKEITKLENEINTEAIKYIEPYKNLEKDKENFLKKINNIELKKKIIKDLEFSIEKKNKLKQFISDIDKFNQKIDNKVNSINVTNTLLDTYDKYQQISNSIESGELDNNINLNKIERLLVFDDSNKEEYNITEKRKGFRPSNFVLANTITSGGYPLAQSNYIIDKNFSNSILSNIIDKLSKCLTNIKTLNKLITKLQNKYISVQQKKEIFDSLKEIKDENEKLNLYDVVIKRVIELLKHNEEKKGKNDEIEIIEVQNVNRDILLDFHKKFQYCIRTINSDMSKVSDNWNKYERNYNQKF